MERFLQVVVDGIADGSIYGALALALVLIFRSTGIVNFAQGEMAMFATFIAWGLYDGGRPLWVALLAAFAASFLGGMAIERLLGGGVRLVCSSSRGAATIRQKLKQDIIEGTVTRERHRPAGCLPCRTRERSWSCSFESGGGVEFAGVGFLAAAIAAHSVVETEQYYRAAIADALEMAAAALAVPAVPAT